MIYLEARVNYADSCEPEIHRRIPHSSAMTQLTGISHDRHITITNQKRSVLTLIFSVFQLHAKLWQSKRWERRRIDAFEAITLNSIDGSLRINIFRVQCTSEFYSSLAISIEASTKWSRCWFKKDQRVSTGVVDHHSPGLILQKKQYTEVAHITFDSDLCCSMMNLYISVRMLISMTMIIYYSIHQVQILKDANDNSFVNA